MLKLQESTATNVLLLFILFFMVLFLFYPFFIGSSTKLDNFVTAVFTTNKNNLEGEVGYVYDINIRPNYIEPEQIYLYKNDVIKVTNNTSIYYDVTEQELPEVNNKLYPSEVYFKKFSESGVYTFILKNQIDNNLRSFVVYVK